VPNPSKTIFRGGCQGGQPEPNDRSNENRNLSSKGKEMFMNEIPMSKLQGKVFTDVQINEDKTEIVFKTTDHERFRMYHVQDCCESVYVEDICGDLSDLIKTPIIQAFETTNQDNPKDNADDSHTWTFYTFATIKGTVTIRWYGESNGYYSESVTIEKIVE
jgi:hypothetical protein